MAFAVESTTPLTINDFMDEPVEVRYSVYMGLATAAIVDVTKVSDQELRLLSYGYFRDTEVREAIGDDNFYSGFQPVFDSVKAQGDKGGVWELMWAKEGGTAKERYASMSETQKALYDASFELSEGNRIEDEGLQIPATAVALVAAFYGGAAALGATGTIGGPAAGIAGASSATGAAGAGAGVASAQSMIASAATPALMLASKIAGLPPSGVIATILKVGSGVIGVTGTIGLNASIFDHIVNTDENEQARADTIADRDAYSNVIAGVDEGYSQAEMDAKERYMGNQPAQIDGVTRGMVGGASGAPPDPSSLSYDRPSGEGQVAPPPAVPGTAVDGQDLIGTPVPNSKDVDPNADNPYVGGLRDGYQASITEAFRSGGQKLREDGSALKVDPVYRTSDFENVVAGLTERTIDWFQDKMVHAGYMKEDQATGLMDTKTIDTMERVMYEANVNGLSWRNWSLEAADAGDLLAASEDASAKEARLKAIGPFQRKVYLEPDYATLATTAKNAMERELGRKINDWEMQLLVAEQQGDYRERYDAEVQVDQLQYDAQVRAVEDDLETGDSFGGGTVQGVDPGARFQQTFESQFEKELNRKGKTRDAEERTSTLMHGLNNAMNAIGGR